MEELARNDRLAIYKLKLAPISVDGALLRHSGVLQTRAINTLPLLPNTNVRLEVDIRITLTGVGMADGDIDVPNSYPRMSEIEVLADRCWKFLSTATNFLKELPCVSKAKIWITSPQKNAYESMEWILQDHAGKWLSGLRLEKLQKTVVIANEDGKRMLELFRWAESGEVVTRSELFERRKTAVGRWQCCTSEHNVVSCPEGSAKAADRTLNSTH